MKRILFTLLTLFLGVNFAYSANRYWVANAASTWNNIANWSTTSGGASGASIPVAGDFVFFNANGLGNCTFDGDVNIDGINTTGYTGIIEIDGWTFNPAIGGTAICIFEGCTLNNAGAAALSYTTTGYTRFNAGATINVPVNVSSNYIGFNGAVFNHPVDVTFTGGTSYNSSGGCTFNSTLKITTTGTNYALLGFTNPDIFNGDVTFINNGASRIRIGYNSAGNQFNGNITVGSTAGSGVWLGEGPTSTSTFATTKTISIDAGGFTTGDLRFKGFTQVLGTPQAFSLTGTASLRFESGTTFNDNINVDAPQIYINGSTFAGTSDFEKTGAVSNASVGGNTFTGNCILTNSGSGYFLLGNGFPDTFSANLTMNNTGSHDMYIATNSAGNTIGGNLTIINSARTILISSQAASSLTVTGNCTATNSSALASSRIYLGNSGDVTFNGTLNIANNSTGASGSVYMAYNTTSSVSVTGATTVTNTTGGTTKYIYLGYTGDVTYNGTLAISNTSSATNSIVFCNTGTTSTGLFNENITVENTNAAGGGVYFGSNGGNGTLAATKTITISAGGFVAGRLLFRNFTQVGNTAHALTLTGTALFENYDSNWGGDVTFIAPRMITRGTTYNRSAYLEKTGANQDDSQGNNLFMMDTELRNSGSNNFTMGVTNPDVFQANLTMNNTGTYYLHIATSSIGNTIAGNLTATNSGSGTNTGMSFAGTSTSDLTVTGTTIINNSASSDNANVFIGNQGDITFNGDLNITNNATGANGYTYLANNTTSQITVNGNTTVNNAGAGSIKRTYLGSNGDITYNGTLAISNSSSATSSQVYCNHAAASTGLYNENITVENTNAAGDGVLFGAATGNGTLAATKTITISGGGFVAGQLFFRNFTQVGNTAHALTLTGTAAFENYDSNWGGDVTFIAPRMITRGTTYNRTAYLEKTGGVNDNSQGNNLFMMNAELRNTGTNRFLMGQNNPDVFQANLILNMMGSGNIYLGYSSIGNTIAGTLTATSSGIGANSFISLTGIAASDLTVTGITTINNIASSTSSSIYLGNQGDVTLNSDLNLTNNASGSTAYFYVAHGSSSQVTVNGNSNVINAGAGTTKRTYLGNSGDITFNGTLAISNTSSATNSQVYCNYGGTSTGLYNDNITVENTNSAGDGVLFGLATGNGTLAATKTITISGGGFVAGQLFFRNFTQVGNTAHALTLTGTAAFENYDSNWGGDVTFIAPRMLTRGTTYNRTSYLEKTGTTNDYSAGGNTFVMNSEIRNTGSSIFLMGNGNPDDWQADLLVNNLGSHHTYIAYNSAGNTIAGNLIANNSGTSGIPSVYFANHSASTLTVTGTTQLNNISTSTNSYIYFPLNGDIVLNNSLSVVNNLNATSAFISIAHGNDASLVVNSNTTVLNNGGNTTKQVFLGNQGDVTFNGTLDITNSSSATNSQVYCNNGVNSIGLYNDNITVESTNASSDGILFGPSGGIGTLAANKTITINGGGFIAGYLYFRNFTQLSATPQTLQPTGTTRLENYNSTWNGNVDFRSPTHYTRGTVYNGTAFLEKNGSGNNPSVGGNTFNGDATMQVTGSGYFMPSNGTANDFNANATYIQTSTGRIYPAYNCEDTFAGDITVNSNGTAIRFGATTNGRAILDGTIAQNINNVGTTTLVEFRDIETQNPNAEITLNTPITVLVELDLQQGNLIATTANLIYANDNSIVSNVSDNAFVDGPLEKIGNDAYIFPVGKTGVYRPIEISNPASGAARFRGEFFPNDVVTDGIPDLPVEAGVHHVSDCEYWILDRIATTNPVNVTLSYKNYSANNCSGVLDPTDLVVARWDGGIWRNHGNGGTTGGPTSGTVITSAAVTSFSPFTLASLVGLNPLPIELIEFTATNNQNEVDLYWLTASESNNDYFTVERSADGENFKPILTKDGAGNSSEMLSYFDVDKSPLSGVSYYRLKQTDFDGEFSYSGVVKINRMSTTSEDISIYPNPVNDIVNVSISENDFTINIYALDGKLVKSVRNKKLINMNDFESGIYQFVIQSSSNYILKTIKVVKL